MFEFNPFALPPFFSALLIITIGVYVLVRNPHSEKHRSLFYFCLSCFVWLFFYTGIYISKYEDQVIKFAQLANLGIIFIPVTNLFFNTTLLRPRKRIFLPILLVIVLLFSHLTFTDLYYVGVYKYFWGFYPKAGMLQHPFLALYIITWLYGLILLKRELNRRTIQRDIATYHQIRNVYIAWFGGSLGVIDFLPKYGIPIYPFAFLVALYWVFISSIAIMQNRLSKRTYMFSRSFLIISAYSISLVLFAHFIYLLLHIVNAKAHNYLIAINALLLGMAIKPFYSRIASLVDRTFFSEYHERNLKLSKLKNNILQTEQEDVEGRNVLSDMYLFFRVTKTSLFLCDDDGRCFLQSSITWGKYKLEKSSNDENIPEIVSYLAQSPYLHLDEVYSTDNIKEKAKVIAWMSRNSLKLCFPIKGDKFYGFLALGEKESGLPYSKIEITELLGALSVMSVIAKLNLLMKLYSQMSNSLTVLMDVSSRDSMTGLYNHRKSCGMLASTFGHCVNFDESIFVIVADIDNFKSINDSYGHPVGDKVIIDFANILQECVIKLDCERSFCGRIGGEEFIVVISGKTVDEFKLFLQEVSNAVKETNIQLYDSNRVRYTVSIGAAMYPGDGKCPDDLILKADEMMYLAKRTGKNRAVFTLDLPVI